MSTDSTDKNQLLLPQSEEKKAVEPLNQSGTLNHTNSRRNSSLFSSQNFQNILDKTNDLPKQFRANFWKSIEILATQEMNVQDINNYVEEGYQNTTKTDKYIIRPIHFLLQALVILCNVVDPIFTIVACSIHLNIPVLVLTSLSILSMITLCFLRRILVYALFLLFYFGLTIATIVLRSTVHLYLVDISYYFSIATVSLSFFFLLLEQVFECCKFKL